MAIDMIPSPTASRDPRATEVLVSSLRKAVASTFERLFGSAPTFHTETQDEPLCEGMIGILSFVGNVNCTMMVGVPRASAVRLTERVFGMELDYDSPDMGDAVGEIANLLGGDFAAYLDEAGFPVGLSTPTFARGIHLEVVLPDSLAAMHDRYDCAAGFFWIKLAVARQTTATPRTMCTHCGR